MALGVLPGYSDRMQLADTLTVGWGGRKCDLGESVTWGISRERAGFRESRKPALVSITPGSLCSLLEDRGRRLTAPTSSLEVLTPVLANDLSVNEKKGLLESSSQQALSVDLPSSPHYPWDFLVSILLLLAVRCLDPSWKHEITRRVWMTNHLHFLSKVPQRMLMGVCVSTLARNLILHKDIG